MTERRHGFTRFVLTGVHAGKTIEFAGGRYKFEDGVAWVLTRSLESPQHYRAYADFGAYPDGEEPEAEEAEHGSDKVQRGGDDAERGPEVDDLGDGGEVGEQPPDEAPVLLAGDGDAAAGQEGPPPAAAGDRPRPTASRRRAAVRPRSGAAE